MKKLMENFNKFVKEEEAMQEQEPEAMEGEGLKQSYTFLIYRPGHDYRDRSTTVMYAENVPVSMLDTKDYDDKVANDPDYVNPERVLEISKEGLQRLGFEPNKYGNFNLDSYPIDQVPETIELSVPYNPRTGEFMTDQVKPYMIPKVVDASSM